MENTVANEEIAQKEECLLLPEYFKAPNTEAFVIGIHTRKRVQKTWVSLPSDEVNIINKFDPLCFDIPTLYRLSPSLSYGETIVVLSSCSCFLRDVNRLYFGCNLKKNHFLIIWKS